MMNVEIDVGLLEGIDGLLGKLEIHAAQLQAVAAVVLPERPPELSCFLAEVRRARAHIREILIVAR